MLRSAKAALRLANRLAEEGYREFLAAYHVRRGRIVVFDRHFRSDYYAYDVAGAGRRQLSRRVHGFFLTRVYPEPDLVVYLDAPVEILLARKGEGTAELLERRRSDYLELRHHAEHFAVVDASRPLGEVTEQVAGLVRGFAETGSVGTTAGAQG